MSKVEQRSKQSSLGTRRGTQVGVSQGGFPEGNATELEFDGMSAWRKGEEKMGRSFQVTEMAEGKGTGPWMHLAHLEDADISYRP